jgi:Kef-type K+ transport system membrane component KefB
MVFWKKLLRTVDAQGPIAHSTEDMSLPFLPSLPFEMSYPLLFGALLVAGMLGGEFARLLRMPRIIGYVVVGFLISPLVAAMQMRPLIEEARIFVDLALGLVLFDLGRRMDVRWMRRDWTLAAAGLAEGALSFLAVFAALVSFRFTPVQAGLAAAIVMTASPAVLLLLVHDTRAEGQVTERALNLVALNGLMASILTTIMLGSAHYEARMDIETAVLHPLYLFLGSLALGGAMAGAARVIARTVEKDREVHFSLIAGLVVAAVGLASLLKLPVILALLAFGLFARNDQRGYDLLNVNLAPVGRLLYIVLFVITGASLPLGLLAGSLTLALVVIGARAAGKLVAILAVAPIGGLRLKQSIGLAACLMPMSSLPLLMLHDILRVSTQFEPELTAAVLSAITIMEIAGPFAVQFGLRLAGESLTELDSTYVNLRAFKARA